MAVHLWVIKRQVHLFDPAHVGCAILSETAGNEAAGGIDAGKDVVGSAGTVDTRAGRDVVNGAINGKVDGAAGVGAVVEGEFFGGYVPRPVLGASSIGQSIKTKVRERRGGGGGLYTHK